MGLGTKIHGFSALARRSGVKKKRRDTGYKIGYVGVHCANKLGRAAALQ